ncbi:unnamed protein product, partial [Notodromas monacha]
MAPGLKGGGGGGGGGCRVVTRAGDVFFGPSFAADEFNECESQHHGREEVRGRDDRQGPSSTYVRDVRDSGSNDETSSTSSEKYERDVAVLNHCFDDIERFIARLQYTAAAQKELERRRKSRKSKKKDLGDGMLSMRARPPPEREFIDIFQKFKLSFNLLAEEGRDFGSGHVANEGSGDERGIELKTYANVPSRKSKKKDLGDGMLSMRARPPPEREFIDIFQKFKLSFNLLAKLRMHIHDPNAPELVHFLFTPLTLIVNASRDPNYATTPNLPAHVVSPMLTRDAVDLLANCLTSKETELWNSLGDVWLVPGSHWKGQAPPYHPVFYDGWTPDYALDLQHRERPESLGVLAAQEARTRLGPELKNADDNVSGR